VRSQIRTREAVCLCDYRDVAAFLISIEVLAAFLRGAVALHLLPNATLEQPTALPHAVILMCILLALYATLKLRHRGAVWRALGWTIPPSQYLVAASLWGPVMASLVTLVGQSQRLPMAPIATWKLAALAGILVPVLEESFFRGCLLPLMAQTSGSPSAVILTALLFAYFHRPPTIVHCVCFTISGIFYGWARVASGSTTAPALMHAVYNLTLLACQKL
jgi:membrane protease YdiL (CAAX protease family)